MNFTDAVKSAYRNFAKFSGRSSRSEFWWFALFTFLVSLVVMVVEGALGLGSSVVESGNGQFSAVYTGGPLTMLWSLANLIPSIALGVRRLHDTDRAGWWYFIALIPLIGAIVLLVFFCTKGTNGPNRFGDDPLRAPADVF